MDRAHPLHVVSPKSQGEKMILSGGDVIEGKDLPEFTPLRIKCPECKRIYTLYIESLEQGLYTLIGQACPFCKRFIREEDNPEDLLVDLAEIRKMMGGDSENKGERHGNSSAPINGRS